MKRLACLVAVALAGCTGFYYPDQVATARIDEEDVEVHVSTIKHLGNAEVRSMADGEAMERCGRYGRVSEFVSFRQIAYKDGFVRRDGPVNRYSILYACIAPE